MTEDEEKKAREDRAKADAEAGTKLDKLLSHMDSFGERMDTLHKRMDAMETKDKARDDAEKSKADASEKEPEEKKDEKKADGEEDEKKKAEEKAKADADEEEKKKADAARKDSTDISEIRAEIAKLAALTPRHVTDDQHAAFADAQARADGVYQMFGKHASRPMQAEDIQAYRLRLARELQPHSPAWKNVNLAVIAVDSVAFGVAERDIYEAARRAALDPSTLGENEIERVVSRTDRETGRTTTEFRRKDSFVKDFSMPPQYITRINTDQRPH